MRKLTRRDMNSKMYHYSYSWPTESNIPSGYVWPDRLIDIGEEVLIWDRLPDGEKGWVKVIARPAHDWWDEERAGFHAPDNMLGGFSFEDPNHLDGEGKLNYYSSLRTKDKWVEDGTEPHGGQHIIIGLHDPNPHVVIRDTGEKEIELDNRGLGYYPITLEELTEHHQPKVTNV